MARRDARASTRAQTRTVPATEFKTHCLSLLDRVAAGQESIVISKRGKPIARLVPIDAALAERRPLIGSVTIVDPSDDLFSTGAVWEAESSR